MNNVDFWNNYLEYLRETINKLCKEKKELLIDLHIHSNYSADGKQTIKEIIDNTNSLGFDIIAITDHDSLSAYDELYTLLKEKHTMPLIVPGIEFTIDCANYGSQCHIIELFINPKERKLLTDVETNYKAMFNRSKLQFKRLKENITMQTIFKKHNIRVNYGEYKRYLNTNKDIPEYSSLCNYLIEKLREKNITTFDILDLLEKNNNLDIYPDRRDYKKKRYSKLREKYDYSEINKYNSRFLLSMLAVREVDDDWWDKPSSGSLSVNSYGQVKIDELKNNYRIFFAHPTEKKMDVVKEIVSKNSNIIGLELNYQNKYNDINGFNKLLKTKKLLKIIGSDSHDNTNKFYDNMNFYKIKSSNFIKIMNCCLGEREEK